MWTDIAVITVAIAAGVAFGSSFYHRNPEGSPPFAEENHVLASLTMRSDLLVRAWLLALGVYDSRRPAVLGTGPEDVYNRVLAASLTAYGLLTLAFYLIDFPPQRSFLIMSGGVGLVLLLLGRWGWRKRLHQQRRRKLNAYRTLLIGERRKSSDVARLLRSNTLAGFDIVGVVTTDPDEADILPGIPVVTTYDNLLGTVERFESTPSS